MAEPVPQTAEPTGTAADSPGPQPLVQCPPFDRARFDRQMALDLAVHWGLGVAAGLAMFYVMVQTPAEGDEAAGVPWPGTVLFLIISLWIVLSVASSRALLRLRQAAALLEQDLAQAEALLARIPLGWPLGRGARLDFYHRLAILRYRQGRYRESAAICQALLGRRDRRLEPRRSALLLMVVEAGLETGDLPAAHQALDQLHARPLALSETLQRLALQTRYLLGIGAYDYALAGVGRTLELAELMPAPQAGMVHALLARAAEKVNRPRLARWLRERAFLLGEPQQMERLVAAESVAGTAGIAPGN